MDSSSQYIPVYKPTPIKPLEEADKHSNSPSPINTSETLLVYRPTPIHELDAYAPVPSSAYSPHISLSTQGYEPPTYSPVIKQPLANFPALEYCLPASHVPTESTLPAKCKQADDGNLEDDKNVRKSSAKRSKILSLYQDLYADDDDKVENAEKPKNVIASPKSETNRISQTLNLPSCCATLPSEQV